MRLYDSNISAWLVLSTWDEVFLRISDFAALVPDSLLSNDLTLVEFQCWPIRKQFDFHATFPSLKITFA